MTDLWAVYLFVFLGLFSPGPNIILLITSGATFGLRKTLPHVFGVALGVGVIAALTGLGVGQILINLPWLRFVLNLVAAIWIFYLAIKIWNSSYTEKTTGASPFTFMQAVLFQWVNPKIWAVALAAFAYVPTASPLISATILGHAFAVINLFVCLFWTATGQATARFLRQKKIWVLFMRVMASLLLAMIVVLFL